VAAPEDAVRALVRVHVAGKHNVRAELEQHRLHRGRHVVHLVLVLLVAVVPARAPAALSGDVRSKLEQRALRPGCRGNHLVLVRLGWLAALNQRNMPGSLSCIHSQPARQAGLRTA
jgi:hypothetical protein